MVVPTTLSFAASYGSHMVLQQAPAHATVWGFAPASMAALAVTLSLAGAGHQSSVPATLSRFNDTALVWRAELPPVAATEPVSSYTLTVAQGAASATIDDVLFGEVWVCSGQCAARTGRTFGSRAARMVCTAAPLARAGRTWPSWSRMPLEAKSWCRTQTTIRPSASSPRAS